MHQFSSSIRIFHHTHIQNGRERYLFHHPVTTIRRRGFSLFEIGVRIPGVLGVAFVTLDHLVLVVSGVVWELWPVCRKVWF